MANVARARVEEVSPEYVDALMAEGAVALDIRDKEEHDVDHISGSLSISRGKLEMMVEGENPDSDTLILCTAMRLTAMHSEQIVQERWDMATQNYIGWSHCVSFFRVWVAKELTVFLL
jgi:rhodanese-related sulfurtransferase